MSLIGTRTVSPSVFTDEVIVTTSLSATFRQQFLQHYNFEVSGGYTTTPYLGFATAANITGDRQLGTPLPALATTFRQGRTDYSRSLRVSVGSTFRQRGTVSIFYSYTDTTSSLSAFALPAPRLVWKWGGVIKRVILTGSRNQGRTADLSMEEECMALQNTGKPASADGPPKVPPPSSRPPPGDSG